MADWLRAKGGSHLSYVVGVLIIFGVLQVPVSKLMMLVAAKWREFSTLNPLNEEQDADEPLEPDYVPKPSRSRASAKVSPPILAAIKMKWEPDKPLII